MTDANSTAICGLTARADAGPPLDFSELKLRQQATWASGNFSVIGTTLQIVGESLAEAVDICADERVLDVAAGNGNASLAAARRFARVTSTDYVPHLLANGATRAHAEGFDIQFESADAEALPYPDASFDVVLSTFGVMFAPNHRQTANELLRVVRGGGRIGLANWTPDGFIGQLFRIVAAYVLPPNGLNSPMLWGTEPHIVELFGFQAAHIHCAQRTFNFRYRSPAHWLDVFRSFYGPTLKVYEALAAVDQRKLSAEIIELLERSNIGKANTLVVPSDYLEVIVERN